MTDPATWTQGALLIEVYKLKGQVNKLVEICEESLEGYKTLSEMKIFSIIQLATLQAMIQRIENTLQSVGVSNVDKAN